MNFSKKRKKKKAKKPAFLFFLLLGIIIFWLGLGFYLIWLRAAPSIYIWPENVKQGDTVFIRVESRAQKVWGEFENEKIDFYKNGARDWIAFLGVDAAHEPGNYKISVSESNNGSLAKEIKVNLADFSSAQAVAAPSQKATGLSKDKALNNIVKSDNPAIKNVLGNLNPSPYFSAPFSFPLAKIQVGGISFGRYVDFAKYKLQHLGADLKADEETDVFAVNDGRVVFAADLSNYGKTIIIDHGLNIFSLYLHLSGIKISNGQLVKKGQLIALSGHTGYTTAPHLHFSMRVGNSRVDPIEFIETSQKISNNFVIADIYSGFINVINSK